LVIPALRCALAAETQFSEGSAVKSNSTLAIGS
jgi:hypothetical protein